MTENQVALAETRNDWDRQSVASRRALLRYLDLPEGFAAEPFNNLDAFTRGILIEDYVREHTTMKINHEKTI